MAFGRAELLSKLSGKRIEITTRCGQFKENQGQIDKVYDDFFVFMTAGPSGTFNQRCMVMFENIGVIRQLPEIEVEDIPIIR